MHETKRIAWIDAAKGIAIILVVMGHVVSSFHAAGQYQASFPLNFINQCIYSFHMASFMFISGFLFKNKPNKKSQIQNILVCYGIPYLTFSLVWWGFKSLLSSFVNSQLTVLDLLLIPFCPMSFLWFIYALMWMEIVQVVIGNPSKRTAVIQIAISLILFLTEPLLTNVCILDTNYHFSDLIVSDFMANYFYFCAGRYLGPSLISLIKKHRVKVISGGSTALLLINLLIYKYNNLYSTGVQLILAIVGVCSFVAVCINWKAKVLTYIGRRTLPIYVLQGIFIAATRVLLGKLMPNSPYGIIPFVICTITGTFIPLVIYELSTRVCHLDFFFTPGKYIKF